MTSLLSTHTGEGLHQPQARVASQELSAHGLELRPKMRREVVETVNLLVSAEPHKTGIGPADIQP